MIINTFVIVIAWTIFGLVGTFYSYSNLVRALGDEAAQRAVGANGELLLIAQANIDAEKSRIIGLLACVAIGLVTLFRIPPTPHPLTWTEGIFDVAFFTIELSKVYNSWRVAKLNQDLKRVSRKEKRSEQ